MKLIISDSCGCGSSINVNNQQTNTLIVKTGPPGPPGPSGSIGPSGSAVWGNITGSISDQTDLYTILNNKETSGSAAIALISASMYTDLEVSSSYSIVSASLTTKLDKTRTVSITTSLTITLDISLYDQYDVTALASALTIANPTGAPFNGQKIIYRLKDNGTARALTFDSNFRFSSDLVAPTTTTINRTLYLGFVWNSTNSKWDNLAQLNNFT